MTRKDRVIADLTAENAKLKAQLTATESGCRDALDAFAERKAENERLSDENASLRAQLDGTRREKVGERWLARRSSDGACWGNPKDLDEARAIAHAGMAAELKVVHVTRYRVKTSRRAEAGNKSTGHALLFAPP